MNNRKFTLLALTLCLLLAGCGMPDNKKEEEKGKEFPDRAMYELKGNVKSVKTIVNNSGVDEPSYELAFDKNGKCTKHMLDGIWDEEEGHLYSTKRNDKEQVVSYTVTGKESKKKRVEIHYSYDEEGKMVSRNSMWNNEEYFIFEKFTYNKSGYMTTLVLEETNGNNLIKTTYNYRSIDKAGNWTERTGHEVYGNGRENIVIEKRQIEYYQ